MATAIVVIKAIHSVIILYFMGCLWILWQYVMTGLYEHWLKWILASLVIEAVVFVAFGFECPLTIWALQLGDKTGADLVSEWFYLEDVQFTTNYAIFCTVGWVLAVKRYTARRGLMLCKR